MLRVILSLPIALTLLLSLPSQANAVLVSASPKTQVPAFSNDGPESRIGLLCHNDPVNKSDPTGLYVTYTDNWSEKDAEKFKKAFDQQWSTKEGRATWEARYNSKNEFRVSPDRTTGTKEQGASNFNIGEYGRKGILQSIGQAFKDAASSVLGMGQSNSNFEKGRQGDNTAKNKQAEQAADKEGLSDTQREIFHDQIHGRELPFNQLREEAAAIKQAYPGK